MTTLSRCRALIPSTSVASGTGKRDRLSAEKAQGRTVCVSSRTLKDDRQRTRGKRIEIIDVSNPKGAIVSIDLNLAGSQNAAILIAEDRYQDLVLKLYFR